MHRAEPKLEVLLYAVVQVTQLPSILTFLYAPPFSSSRAPVYSVTR